MPDAVQTRGLGDIREAPLPFISIQPAPRAIGEEQIRPMIAVIVDGTDTTEGILDHLESQIDLTRIQVRITLVLVVDTDGSRVDVGEAASLADHAHPFD